MNPTPEHVIRYVPTHINKEGYRTLILPQQGRYTFATQEEAQTWIDTMRSSFDKETMEVAYCSPDTMEVRPCECWPGHFDPMRRYFDTMSAGVARPGPNPDVRDHKEHVGYFTGIPVEPR